MRRERHQHSSRKGAAWLLAATLSLCAGPAGAQIASVTGPVPASADNPIYGAADVPESRLGLNLTPFGYVEQEYFISGKAAAYKHGPDGPVPLTGKLPYTTRIIVRRPADPARFSGVVHFEPIHPTQGYNGDWLVLDRYLMSRGDIYVFAGVGDANKGWSGSPQVHGPDSPIGAMLIAKWFNPKRYASLAWPEEEGIRYEVMADIGKKLRSEDPDNPLHGLEVKAMLMGGWSYTGSIQRTFINEGFHDRARLPDGKPVFDGYLIGVSSPNNNPGYLPLYNDEPFVPLDDPRRILKKTDAKVIEFITESEVEMAKQPELPDSDAKLGALRVYELPGVVHVDSLADPNESSTARPYDMQLLLHGYKFASVSSVSFRDCGLPQSDLPQGALVRAAVDNLRRWVLDGTPPPHAAQMEKKDGQPVRDSAGNIEGGLRIAELDLPLAHYGRYEGSAHPECRAENAYPSVFFVRDELPRDELIRRYGTPQHYIELYDAAIDREVAGNWLLPVDALRLKAKIREHLTDGF